MNADGRHLVLISNPRVTDGKMLLTLCVHDWSEHECFFYPLDNIDCKSVLCHVLFRLSGDDKVIVRASAEMDIEEKNPSELNIRNWGFA